MDLRIPYPESIPYPAATAFAGVLLVVQLLQHTDPLFAACCFAYILVATAAFNIAGGLYRPAGAYVFFNAVLAVILGLVVKAVLGEAAQKNLIDGMRLIQVYLLGMVSALAAAYIENRLRSRHPLLSTRLALPNLRTAYVGAALYGIAITIYFLIPLEHSAVAISIRNVSGLSLPFSVILGVIYTVRSTHGRKSTNGWLIFIMVLTTAEALLSFSKQAMFTPAFCWIVGAAVSRYRLRRVNLIALVLIVYLSISYGNPYSEYGRDVESTQGSVLSNIPIAYFLLTHMSEVKRDYSADEVGAYNQLNYYDRPMGIFDRLQLIGIDDALVAITDQRGYFGYEPYKEGIENMVPTILWPNKPKPYFGNTYMHELGAISTDDTTTGVSFSASADAYHEGGFFAVIVMQGLSLAIVFLVFSYLLGDVRDNPIVLALILVLGHFGPEGAFFALPALITISIFAVIFAFVCKYVLPVISSAFERQKIAAPVFGSVPISGWTRSYPAAETAAKPRNRS